MQTPSNNNRLAYTKTVTNVDYLPNRSGAVGALITEGIEELRSKAAREGVSIDHMHLRLTLEAEAE